MTSPTPKRSGSLDPIDCRIISVLQQHGRLAIADLAREINLSPPAVSQRLKRLEKEKVITGYRATVDAPRIGFPIAALVRIRPSTSQLQKIPALAKEIPEVVECHRVTGDD